jgi:hypothetical protein
MVKQAAGRGNADCWVGVVQGFFDKRQHGKRRKLSQRLGGKQTWLRLLVLKQRLKYGKRLLVECGAERLCRGGAYGWIRMPCKVCGDEDCTLVAEAE